MQIFVRDLQSHCCPLVVDACTPVAGLKDQIQDTCGLPASEQLLVHGGHVLHDASSLQACGLTQDATVTLLLRLRGGKGGFGALLRGQGRDGKVTTNFDACRDLNGKRLRLVNAEKEQAEWQAKAPEREAEKAYVAQLKDLARKEKRAEDSEVHVEEVNAEQRQLVAGVQDAVQDALQALNAKPEGAAAGVQKRKDSSERAPPAKKSKMFSLLEDFSSGSESDSDSEESNATKATTH